MPAKKSRKTYKNKPSVRKTKKHGRNNKLVKLKGGNFGGNCPDPNFSIYNTNLLKLFPYHF